MQLSKIFSNGMWSIWLVTGAFFMCMSSWFNPVGLYSGWLLPTLGFICWAFFLIGFILWLGEYIKGHSSKYKKL